VYLADEQKTLFEQLLPRWYGVALIVGLVVMFIGAWCGSLVVRGQHARKCSEVYQ
jgi:hypothetical protein